MNKIRFWAIVHLLSLATIAHSQSFYFGPKLGLGINTQQWDGFDRNPLFNFFGDVFIETYVEDSPSSFFAQLGYHTRGSSLRNFGFGGF